MTIASLFGTRLLSGIAALAITGSLTGAALTAEAAPGRAGKQEREAEQEMKREGKQAVHELRASVKQQTKVEREAIAELREQLADEYAKDQPDRATIERLRAEIEAKRDAIADERHAALMEIHDELTPEQRAAVAERMIEGKRAKHREGPEAKAKPKPDKQAKAGKPEGRELSAKGKRKPKPRVESKSDVKAAG